jgi:hypothetical protein
MGSRDIDMKDFIEQRILEAVRRLLSGRVNELLAELEYPIGIIEFTDYRGGSVITPVVCLTTCERTEKERIIRLDAYTLTINFSLRETLESELYCYAYTAAICKALGEDPTLGGVADRVSFTGKKYTPPKKAYGGNEWEVAITLRVTVEGIN